MNLLDKIRKMFGTSARVAEFPSQADYYERRPSWAEVAAQRERAVAELVASMSLEQARELYTREQQFELARLACEHDLREGCDDCQAAYMWEYGPVPPEYEASEISRRAVAQIMTRDDPDTVAAAAQALYQARDRAAAARAQVIEQARRGMTYDEARELLRKQEAYDYSDAYPRPDSRQVEAARRVVASGAKYAISRTQPLPVVPARLGAAGTNAAIHLLRAEEAAAERALQGARATHDPAAEDGPTSWEDVREEVAEERLDAARKAIRDAEGHARTGGDVNAWWLDQLRGAETAAERDLQEARDDHARADGEPGYHPGSYEMREDWAEANLAEARQARQAAEHALAEGAHVYTRARERAVNALNAAGEEETSADADTDAERAVDQVFGEHQANTGPSDTVDPAGERPSRQALAQAVDRPVELDRLWLAEHKAAAELNHMETGQWKYGWYYTPEQWEQARQEAQRTQQAREARFPEVERPTTEFQDWWSQVGRLANPDTERLSASAEPALDSDSAADARGGGELRDGDDRAAREVLDEAPVEQLRREDAAAAAPVKERPVPGRQQVVEDAENTLPTAGGVAYWTDKLLGVVAAEPPNHEQRIKVLDQFTDMAIVAGNPDVAEAAARLAKEMEIARAFIEPVVPPGQPPAVLAPEHHRAILERTRTETAQPPRRKTRQRARIEERIAESKQADQRRTEAKLADEAALWASTERSEHNTPRARGVEEIRAALERLPDGPVTREMLASVGVSRAEWSAVVDADADAEFQQRHAERERDIDAIERSLNLEEARAIDVAEREYATHAQSCNLAAEHCPTCSTRENQSSDEARYGDAELQAARRVINRASAEPGSTPARDESRRPDTRGEQGPVGFGFVAPHSRDHGDEGAGAAVEAARDAVTDLRTQRVEADIERAERDRAQQTNLWATHRHDTGIEHGTGLSADGYGARW